MEIERTPGAALLCRLNPREQFLHITTGSQYLGGMNGSVQQHSQRLARVTALRVTPAAVILLVTDLRTATPTDRVAVADIEALPPYHREKVHRLQAWLRAGGQAPARCAS